ncbi:DNA ligase LigA-related protein [Brucella sp. 2716]|uniref:DNA ligase LigA-related protein n=1 Tax=Brucella sp. 2716 TaxID=2975052 RepID=UPI0038F65677
MLYYGLEESVLSDHEFDALCCRVADNWKDLTPQRRFCLGSASAIRSSGFHVRVSTIAECAAISWLRSLGRYDPEGNREIYSTTPQRFSKVVGRWRPAPAFMWVAH